MKQNNTPIYLKIHKHQYYEIKFIMLVIIIILLLCIALIILSTQQQIEQNRNLTQILNLYARKQHINNNCLKLQQITNLTKTNAPQITYSTVLKLALLPYNNSIQNKQQLQQLISSLIKLKGITFNTYFQKNTSINTLTAIVMHCIVLQIPNNKILYQFIYS